MLKIIPKNSDAINSIQVVSVRASKHADSTQIHNTALLEIKYKCDVKDQTKHWIFVIDTSTSMKLLGIENAQGKKISRTQAIQEILPTIITSTDKNSKDVYSIITFNNKAEIIADGKNFGDEVGSINFKMHWDCGTSIYHGLLKIKELESFNKFSAHNTLIILFTDGQSTIINTEACPVLSSDVQWLLQQKSPPDCIKLCNHGNQLTEYKINYQYFDPQEILKALTSNGECPRIIPVGMGSEYDYRYVAHLGHATNMPIIHVTNCNDFSRIWDGALMKTAIPVNIVLGTDPNNLSSQEGTLYAGEDEKIIFTLDKKRLIDLFQINDLESGKLQDVPNAILKVAVNNKSNDVKININDLNIIDRDIVLNFYKGKKYDMLNLTGNITLNLMWDIPHTNHFSNDSECNSERCKLFQEVQELNSANHYGRGYKYQRLSNIHYAKPLGYVKPTSQNAIDDMEQKKEHICSITQDVMQKPTSVLAFSKKSGSVSKQTYDLQSLYQLANLDSSTSTRDVLDSECQAREIADPNTGMLIIAPRRDYIEEKAMECSYLFGELPYYDTEIL